MRLCFSWSSIKFTFNLLKDLRYVGISTITLDWRTNLRRSEISHGHTTPFFLFSDFYILLSLFIHSPATNQHHTFDNLQSFHIKVYSSCVIYHEGYLHSKKSNQKCLQTPRFHTNHGIGERDPIWSRRTSCHVEGCWFVGGCCSGEGILYCVCPLFVLCLVLLFAVILLVHAME